MKKTICLAFVLAGCSGSAMAQNITVDVPTGYKVVVVPSSVTVAQAINVTSSTPQVVYAAPAPAPAPVYHPRARHVAGVAEGMVIEHQADDHH